MRFPGILAALILAGAASAAPKPYSAPATAEVLFEAGSPQRAAALAGVLNHPLFASAKRVSPCRLAAEVAGQSAVRVTVTGAGDAKALAGVRKVVEAVVAEPSKEELAALLALEAQRLMIDEQINGRFVGMGRVRLIKCGVGLERAATLTPEQEIRLRRPTVASPPRLVR